jgi:hypothetical protein
MIHNFLTILFVLLFFVLLVFLLQDEPKVSSGCEVCKDQGIIKAMDYHGTLVAWQDEDANQYFERDGEVCKLWRVK